MAFGVQGFGFNAQFNSVSSFSGGGFQSGGVSNSSLSALRALWFKLHSAYTLEVDAVKLLCD